MMNKLGIKPGGILLVDERYGKIVMEKSDIEEFIQWLTKTRKKITKDIYEFSFGGRVRIRVFLDANYIIYLKLP